MLFSEPKMGLTMKLSCGSFICKSVDNYSLSYWHYINTRAASETVQKLTENKASQP